jgi:hypothetical protein
MLSNNDYGRNGETHKLAVIAFNQHLFGDSAISGNVEVVRLRSEYRNRSLFADFGHLIVTNVLTKC